MASLDISPLFRTTVGFDRMFDHMASTMRPENNWPPYDIIKAGDDEYLVSIAVPGFTAADLDIETRDGRLWISGKTVSGKDVEYLYNGIKNTPFKLSFELAEHMRVTDATLNDGLLAINIVREVPKALRPKRISVQVGDDTNKPASIVQDAAAA